MNELNSPRVVLNMRRAKSELKYLLEHEGLSADGLKRDLAIRLAEHQKEQFLKAWRVIADR